MTSTSTAPRQRDYAGLFAEFWPLYQQRPIKDNRGGCMLPQLFAIWVLAREVRPTHIIESGVWKGQTTWLFETTLPEATILSIDPVLTTREWTSGRATYSDIDLGYQDLSGFPVSTTLAFIDDHQNAFKRFLQLNAWGIRHMLFGDNYPAGVSDPPLRQIRNGTPAGSPPQDWRSKLKSLLRNRVARFDDYAERYDPEALRSALAAFRFTYEEFPPLARVPTTRWGLSWNDAYGDLSPCIDAAKFTAEQAAEVTATAIGYNSPCLVRMMDDRVTG